MFNPDFKPVFPLKSFLDARKLEYFLKEKLKERNASKDLDAAKQATSVNINQAVSMFTATMKRVSECMNKKVNVTKHYPRQTWFDKECHIICR